MGALTKLAADVSISEEDDGEKSSNHLGSLESEEYTGSLCENNRGNRSERFGMKIDQIERKRFGTGDDDAGPERFEKASMGDRCCLPKVGEVDAERKGATRWEEEEKRWLAVVGRNRQQQCQKKATMNQGSRNRTWKIRCSSNPG